MILEMVLNMIFGLLLLIMDLLPSISIPIPDDLGANLANMIRTTWDFLPMADLLLMFGIWFAITNFQIIWKTVTRIWDALPFT